MSLVRKRILAPFWPLLKTEPAKLVRRRSALPSPSKAHPTLLAARRLNRAAGMIAGSVLIDSAMEHYRGNFHNKAMWTPLMTSALSIAVSAHGLSDDRHRAHPVRDVVYAAAGLVGIVGTFFHLYNVTKKVGGFSWQNLFYAAPLGAPAAMSLAGLIGFMAERVRDNPPNEEPRVFGLPAGRVVAATTGLSLIGTTAEAGLLHFRGAFHNPAMLLPVTMPPLAAGLLAEAAFGPAGIEPARLQSFSGGDSGDGRRRRSAARLWRLARYGRMAQLAAKCVLGAAPAGAAVVQRPRPRRAGGAVAVERTRP